MLSDIEEVVSRRYGNEQCRQVVVSVVVIKVVIISSHILKKKTTHVKKRNLYKWAHSGPRAAGHRGGQNWG